MIRIPFRLHVEYAGGGVHTQRNLVRDNRGCFDAVIYCRTGDPYLSRQFNGRSLGVFSDSIDVKEGD